MAQWVKRPCHRLVGWIPSWNLSRGARREPAPHSCSLSSTRVLAPILHHMYTVKIKCYTSVSFYAFSWCYCYTCLHLLMLQTQQRAVITISHLPLYIVVIIFLPSVITSLAGGSFITTYLPCAVVGNYSCISQSYRLSNTLCLLFLYTYIKIS